ncbi:MAG: DNA polymerase IV [Acidimicrobiales bacterium]
MEQAAILHADLDAFYASVEQLLDPSLRDKPIAVGGGVVLAASYEAKARGVQSGMPGRKAKKLCPELIFVSGHFDKYQKLGDQAIDVMRDFTPIVERISIDEAFLDVAGSIHLFGSPLEMAQEIRQRVRDEIGLPISVGIARTKHLAKIASQVAKPDGLVEVPPEGELAFLHPLPVGLMWGVGPVTKRRLAERGVHTIGELAAMRDTDVQNLLGHAVGSKLGALAWNEDPRPLETRRRAKSVGAQSAMGKKPVDVQLIERYLLHLADRVATRLRAKHREARTITVRVRFTDMASVTRSITLPTAISATSLLAEIAADLVQNALRDHPDEQFISLLAINVSGLLENPPQQLELPLEMPGDGSRSSAAREVARRKLDEHIDSARDKFGRDSIGFASVMLEHSGSVPDEFRELAEK